ncbi:MAG: hypothetical protein AMJ73_02005 [candidate division Zixibacteria bacterium SM1_73]|nr:MAG: hypothetical protein AMJ73_02005 [candidate division Zixibacteria bacterium SM1_73]
MKKFISLFLVFSILALSGNLFAKEKRGANIAIYTVGVGEIKPKMEGTPWETIRPEIRGELIAVNQNSLLLLERNSGTDVTVDISEIKAVRIIKKSKALVGLFIGGLVGAGFGLLTYSESNFFDFGASGNAAGGAILFGLPGLVIGAVLGTDKTIKFEGKSNSEIQEILETLRKKARIKNAQ